MFGKKKYRETQRVREGGKEVFGVLAAAVKVSPRRVSIREDEKKKTGRRE